MKIQKKIFFFFLGGGGGSGPGGGGGSQGGCEQRIEVLGWSGGGGGLGVRVDVNEELKFCENSKKQNKMGGGGSGWM